MLETISEQYKGFTITYDRNNNVARDSLRSVVDKHLGDLKQIISRPPKITEQEPFVLDSHDPRSSPHWRGNPSLVSRVEKRYAGCPYH